ncbi:unnamed protein product, partial [Aphanomyces euteiches]
SDEAAKTTTKTALPKCNPIDAIGIVGKVLFNANFKQCKDDTGLKLSMTELPGADIVEKAKESEACKALYDAIKTTLTEDPMAQCTIKGKPLLEFIGSTVVSFFEALSALKLSE